MTHALRAPVALSCGEPSGIGPEIALKAWQAIGHEVPFFWIGDPAHLPAGAEWHAISAPDQVMASQQTTMPVLEHRFAAPAPAGVPAPENAQSVIDVIARGVDLVRSGQAAALCTAPIHKKALQDGAQFAYLATTTKRNSSSSTVAIYDMDTGAIHDTQAAAPPLGWLVAWRPALP